MAMVATLMQLEARKVLKIWGRRNSINVQKVLWCSDELALEYERIDAGMSFGVVNEAFFHALNPNARVPTIDDDGFVLWESNAIVRYLTAKHATGSLCPPALPQRAQAEQWMDWQQTALVPDLTVVFWGLIRTDPKQQNRDAIAAAAARLGDLFGILDAHLDGNNYMLGDAFTMADIPVGACTWRWANLDIERPRLANVERWHETLKARPAFAEHVMLPLT